MTVLFPENFDLSDEAAAEIRHMIENGAVRLGVPTEDVIPALMWIDGALNNHTIQSQVAIGFFQRNELEPEDIVSISGVPMTVAMPNETLTLFNGKRLDLIAGRLTLTNRIVS